MEGKESKHPESFSKYVRNEMKTLGYDDSIFSESQIDYLAQFVEKLWTTLQTKTVDELLTGDLKKTALQDAQMHPNTPLQDRTCSYVLNEIIDCIGDVARRSEVSLSDILKDEDITIEDIVREDDELGELFERVGMSF